MALPSTIRKSLLRSQKKRRRVLLAQTWWEDRVLQGVASYAVTHDWELDCRMKWTHQLPADATTMDGIIVNIGVSHALRITSRPLVNFVRSSHVPVVDMQEFSDVFHAPKVIVSQAEVGRLAARHLVDLGFNLVGYVMFQENALECARRDGFRDVVINAGRVFREFTPKSLARELPSLPGATGLATLNDLNALQVVRLLQDAGRKVPEEFAVLGADDTEILCNLSVVPLSSVSCDFERQGYEAAAMLDRLMNGAKGMPKPVVIPPQGVTVRRSTDSVAIPDLDAARMLRFLRDHHRETFSIAHASEAIGVSLRGAQLAFKKYLGHSLIQELTRLRVDDAKRRLSGDDPPKLEVIAHECGFSNRFHFIQAFRRTTGLSPKAWRTAQNVKTKAMTAAKG